MPRQRQPTVDGIRGHLIYTEAELRMQEVASKLQPLITKEQLDILDLDPSAVTDE